MKLIKLVLKSIKSYIKLFLFIIVNKIALKENVVVNEKSVLLIRIDATGDYILFRNFIKIIRKSDKYKNYKITLLGNEVWKKIAEELDGKFIDNFIWLNRKKFNKNFIYRYQKFTEIVINGYEIVINPRYSPEFYI